MSVVRSARRRGRPRLGEEKNPRPPVRQQRGGGAGEQRQSVNLGLSLA